VARIGVPSFHWWRTVFFLIPTIAVYTTVLGTLSLLSSFVDGHGRLAHKCARAWSWLILATTGVNVRVAGLERVPRGQSYLFVSNHQSIYDIPVLFWSLPFDLRIIAKASLGNFPFLGWHLRRTGHVLVQRDNPGAQVFKQIARLMEEGHSLMVFPEGTRSRDGAVQRFKSGIFRLAIQSGLPVVPIAVRATRHVMRKGQLTTSPAQVSMEVFAPIPTTGFEVEQASDFAARVRAIVLDATAGDADPGSESAGTTIERAAGAPSFEETEGQRAGEERRQRV